MNTLKDLLVDSSNRYGEKILYPQNSISFHEFRNQAISLASTMMNMGLRGEKIGIISENRYEWEVAFFAITCANCIIVPIDKSLPSNEIKTIIERANIVAIFCSESFEKELKELSKEIQKFKYIISFDAEDDISFHHMISIGNELVESGESCALDNLIKENDICAIIFTSGTTEMSKAVMLSHHNVCCNVINTGKVFDIDDKDICLSVLPLNHVLEGLFCFLQSIYKGLARVFCQNLDEIIDYFEKYQITYMGGVPAIYEYLYMQKDKLAKEATHVKMLMSGGAKLDSQLVQKYQEIGIKLIQGYGLTECSPVVSIENTRNRKLGSCGKILPNLDVRIINQDEENIGELIIKGNTVMCGYLHDENTTNDTIHDGYFYTGDLGRIDEEGYLFIFGRCKNMIILSNGKKVFPEEIENQINAVPGVRESIVYQLNNKINATIVYDNQYSKNESNDIRECIKVEIAKINKLLPQYKRIHDVNFSSIELEKTSSGKIKRNDISSYGEPPIATSETNTIFDRIVNLIRTKTTNPQILMNSNLVIDLGLDSLELVEIFLLLEKEFHISLTHEERNSIKKIKDIVAIVEQLYK